MEAMQEYAYTDRWGNEYVLTFTKAKYYDNSNLAIIAYNQGDFGWEPYANITVNIDVLDNPYEAAIDTNNLGDDMLAWLEDNHLAAYTGRDLPSGFCVFPIVEFDHRWIDSLQDESAE